MTRMTRVLAGVAGVALVATGCGDGGGSSSAQGGQPTFEIVIRNMSFSPAELAVPPGATVTVTNQDGNIPHSVTSETEPGAFTPGAAGGVQFDTGAFTGRATITIPEGTTAGTVIPYYCSVHTSSMTPPDGAIRVDAGAQPVGGGGGAGGGY